MTDFTNLLAQIDEGQPAAAAKLLELLYDELRQLAAARLAQERVGQTLQATALVHEAYLRLTQHESQQVWQGRAHFFAAAAEAMRRILVDRARRRNAVKRGRGMTRVDLDSACQVTPETPQVDVLALDEALQSLAAESAIKAELVKLRFFAGLSMQEAAEVLGISLATAERHWTFARCWLYDRLAAEDDTRTNL